MVDLHTHILPDIDDGSKSLEESIEILRKYLEDGLKEIVLTPHYMEDSEYSISNDIKKEKFNLLKEAVKQQNMDINLYLGNEVYASNNILDLLKENKIMTINNSRYILIEFPMLNYSNNYIDIVYNLKLSGIVPIIAHPERYAYIQNDINIAEEFVKKGALLQINKGSLFGRYGTSVFKTAKHLLKKRLVHFVGTDIHSTDGYYSTEKFKKMIIKITDKKYAEEILEVNGLKVLNNEKID
jgi:protein-tyrosine phosphatase